MSVGPAGFASSNTTGTPDTLFDYWLPRLTGAQLRVLLFLIRRCYGPTHQIDPSAVRISLPQFQKGTTGRDGRTTCGCGIASKSTLTGALKSLEGLGLIVKVMAMDGRGGSGTNTYRLVVRDHPATRVEDGFHPLNTTPTPDDLFDVWLDRLSDVELRILLYIVRHTLGWRKAQDAIDPGQFMKGIQTRDGRVVDEGCGVKTREFLYQALGGLEKRASCTGSGDNTLRSGTSRRATCSASRTIFPISCAPPRARRRMTSTTRETKRSARACLTP